MTTVNGVGKQLVAFRGEQDEPKSGGMGIGVPIATTLLGGIGGYALSRQPEADEFKAMVKANDIKLKDGQTLTAEEESQLKALKSEIEAEEKTSGDAAKESKPAATETTTGTPIAEKTEAEKLFDQKVKDYFGEKGTEVPARVLLDGETIDGYKQILAADEKLIGGKHKVKEELGKQIQAQKEKLSRARQNLKDELALETAEPQTKAALDARAKMQTELAKAKQEAASARAELEYAKKFLPDDVKTIESKVAEKQTAVDNLTELTSTPHEKAIKKAIKAAEKADKEAITAEVAAVKAEKEAADAKTANAADAEIKATAAKTARQEATAKRALEREQQQLFETMQGINPEARKSILEGNVNSVVRELEATEGTLKTTESEIARLTQEHTAKRARLELVDGNITGKVSKEAFVSKLKPAGVTISGTTASAGGEATKALPKLEEALKTVGSKLEKVRNWKRAGVGAGIGLAAGLIIKWMFGGKSEDQA